MMITLTVIKHLWIMMSNDNYFLKDNGMLQFKLEHMFINRFIQKSDKINTQNGQYFELFGVEYYTIFSFEN